jgi:pimeloyl-ACP methyl ester carboxylesterase
MRRLVLALAVLLVAGVQATPALAAKPRTGPAGLKFYTPPSPLPGKSHGDVIWARKLTGQDVLKNASANWLVLYRETGVDGKPTAVSGTVAIPKGKAPKGGWPVITWAHGTTGIADTCAPSITNVNAHYDFALLQGWLKAGYAVVRTDYEGLGTPGIHPFLIGTSEGRAVLDMATAARQLDSSLGKKVLISGHSQGGHAALWAASLAAKWTPKLKIVGTAAFAPANHLGEQAVALPGLTSPSSLSGLASLIIRAVDATSPDLGIASQLSDPATALYPQTLTKCLPDLEKTDSFGGLAPASLFKAGADTAPLIAKLNANDPEDLVFKTPLLIEQGEADTTVFPGLTDETVAEYKSHGMHPTYDTYDGVTHEQVVKTGAKDASAWIAKRF